MREYGSNIILPSLDNLFSSEQERQNAKLEKIQILQLSELHPFEGHPFQVRDDEEMDKMWKTFPQLRCRSGKMWLLWFGKRKRYKDRRWRRRIKNSLILS